MRRAQRGFTLIEVVVAFVMLATVLAIGFEIFTTGLRRAGDLEDQSRALLIAQSQLAMAGAEEPLKAGLAQGETADRRYRWTLQITPSEEGAGDPARAVVAAYLLYRIDARVDWVGGDGREHTLALATLGLGTRQ